MVNIISNDKIREISRRLDAIGNPINVNRIYVFTLKKGSCKLYFCYVTDYTVVNSKKVKVAIFRTSHTTVKGEQIVTNFENFKDMHLYSSRLIAVM